MVVKSKLETFVSSNRKSKEPALALGAVTTFVAAFIIICLKLFFPDVVSDEIESSIYGFVGLLFPIITAFLIRRKVWSPASVEDVIEKAVTSAKDIAEKNPSATKAPRILP